jgi:oligopeptide/dipeptide ABC transporter ATP-binding protein
MSDSVLEIEELRVEIRRAETTIVPIDSVSLALRRGECLGIVGESGSGKTLTLRALIGLLPRGGRIARGTMRFRPTATAPLAAYDPAAIRGRGMAMVFQEPAAALNPVLRAADLIAEGLVVNGGLKHRDARRQAISLMRNVGIPDPERRARAWPHELSGGLRQRLLIAMALAGEPQVLLCDEPTTALDVTVQDQILGLLDRVRKERGVSIIFVTHDLAVVRQIADKVAVMYAGRIAEYGSTDQVLRDPHHPYTHGLLDAALSVDGPKGRLTSIPGAPPDPAHPPSGCRFWPRCSHALHECQAAPHSLRSIGPRHFTACIRDDLGERAPTR